MHTYHCLNLGGGGGGTWGICSNVLYIVMHSKWYSWYVTMWAKHLVLVKTSLWVGILQLVVVRVKQVFVSASIKPLEILLLWGGRGDDA